MSFFEKMVGGTPTLSYEVFPPKNPAGWGALYSTLGEVARQSPDFISVTYGAGGSTREKTVDLVRRIRKELEIEAVAHITCVGHSQSELGEIFAALTSSGIGAVMALRGDPPKGSTGFTPHPEGFTHASELIAFARTGFNFHLGCAFYPEKHPEAATLDDDIRALKMKQDAGADFAVSQLFFDNDAFYQYRERARAAGVTLPLVAGIMPVTAVSQFKHFTELSGTGIPAKLLDFLGDAADDDAVAARGVEYGIEQCADLLENGIAGIHLYTLNKSSASLKITRGLRAKGYFKPPAK